MRLGLCAAAAAVVVATAASPAAAAIDAGSRLVVAVELHAGGNDAITACQDKPFGEGVEDFADSIAAALGLPLTQIAASPGRQCLALLPEGSVTRPGSKGERVFRVDGGSLRSLADRAGYAEAFLVVCTPRLTSRVDVRAGEQPLEASGCDANGYAWSLLEPLDVDVAYRATLMDLVGGLMSATSWWIALAVLAWLAALRGSRSGIVKRMPFAAGALGAFGAAAAAWGWMLVATRSSLLDALQVKANLGSPGQTAIVAGGAGIAALFAAFSTRHAIRAARRPQAVPAAAQPLLPGVPSLPLRDVVAPYPGIVGRAGAGLLWAFVPGVALMFAYLIFLVTPAALEIKIEGMLAVALAYALLTPALAGATYPAVFNAHRMEAESERDVRASLRETASRVHEVWVTPIPPAAAPAGGAIMIAGPRAFVWHPLAAMPAAELAGAIALRGSRRRTWAGAGGAALVTVVMNALSPGSGVPAVVMTGAVAIVAGLGFTDALERIRIHTATRSATLAEAHLRGALMAGRAHARLAAGGALGVVAVPMPGYAQAHWERTLRITHRIGLQAGLTTVDVARIADEVVAEDAHRAMPVLTDPAAAAAGATAAAPISTAVAVVPATEQSLPKRPPEKPAVKKQPAAKKTAVAEKKPAARKKAATRRAPARSGRRPRS